MSTVTAELNYLSASEALDHFKSGHLSPVELLGAVIEQVEKIADSVNPFADLYFDEARLAAKKSEDRYTLRSVRRTPVTLRRQFLRTGHLP